MSEFKTEHRISEIMKSLKLTNEEVRRVYYAFDKLVILKKRFPDSYIKRNHRAYLIDCSMDKTYITKMQWINEFMRSKGYPEDLFRNVYDFYTSVDDYDYYNEYKTPTDYALDEVNRAQEK